MAAVTATILLGGSHPNEISVDTYYIMKLWEGDRAAWTVHSLEDPKFERRVLPASPETIHTEGCALINNLVRELGIGAVMLTALEQSSIEKHLDEMAQLICDVDVHLLTTRGSRTYSRWKNEWIYSGSLKS
jgi:hypothetical protein